MPLQASYHLFLFLQLLMLLHLSHLSAEACRTKQPAISSADDIEISCSLALSVTHLADEVTEKFLMAAFAKFGTISVSHSDCNFLLVRTVIVTTETTDAACTIHFKILDTAWGSSVENFHKSSADHPQIITHYVELTCTLYHVWI